MAVDLTIDTSAIVDTQTADASDVTTPFADVETHLENILNGVQQFDQLRLNTVSEVTIATGAITISQSYHTVDTEADAATDDLDTISGGSAGDILYITTVNDARDVTLRHAVGNILTWDGSNLALDNTRKCAELIYDGTNWRVVSVIGGSSGADTTLSNLAAVAINTSLISDADSTDDLGSTSTYWRNLYADTAYLTEQSAPATPATGKAVLYPKTDGKIYFKNDGGTEYDLTAGGSVTITQDNYTANEGTDYTTSSTSFVDVDAAGFSLSITTTGNPVLVGFTGVTFMGGSGQEMYFDVDIDSGTPMFGDDGVAMNESNRRHSTTFLKLVTGLSAATHTFDLQWKVSANTGTLYAGAGTASYDLHPHFFVMEIS